MCFSLKRHDAQDNADQQLTLYMEMQSQIKGVKGDSPHLLNKLKELLFTFLTIGLNIFYFITLQSINVFA